MGRPKKNQEDTASEEAIKDDQGMPEESRVAPEKPEEAAPASADEPRLTPPSQDLPSSEPEGDYLRKYQYRKQTVPGSVDSDPPAGSKAEVMKRSLLAQRKVSFFVPRLPGEDKTVLASVTLNGYRLDFPKQTYIEIPLQVAQILAESLQITEEALGRLRIDGDAKKEKALL